MDGVPGEDQETWRGENACVENGGGGGGGGVRHDESPAEVAAEPRGALQERREETRESDAGDEVEEDAAGAEELSGIPEDAESLRRELLLCRRRLRKAERLHGTVQRYNEELRAQVETLSKQVHELKKNRRQKTDAETQTDDGCADTAQLGYDYGVSEYPPTAESAVESQQEQPQPPLEMSTSQSEEQSEEPAEAEGVSLADSLRAAAEDAMQQSGMVYDEGTGLYYDYTTGFYYDATTQMYYDPNNGHYYYYDSEKSTYEYYTSVDLQPAEGTTKTKKQKHKKKDLEKEDKSRRSTKRHSGERKRDREADRDRSKKRLKRSGRHHRKAADCITDDEDEERERRERRRRRHRRRSSSAGRGSETEEGEISDSEEPTSSSSDSSSDSSNAQSNACEDSEEQQWPPCIRVMVVRSPVLQPGTLFIITSDASATIGREKDMDHTIRIPEMGVSKFHAEVHFDAERQKYVLMDQGSQNGTIINGNRILQPKESSDPHPLDHGDEVKFGETVLSFHIHPASETCDGCEPGQVIAHLRLNQKQALRPGVSLLSKEAKEKIRLKELKQMKAKYGLQSSAQEDQEVINNSRYANRAEQRRRAVGSEHPRHKDDAPASMHEEIDRGNKGRKLLEKMGWKHGEGLGRDSAGIKEPIKPHAMNKQAGLGSAPQLPADSPLLAAGNSRRAQNWEKARERFESFTTQTSKAAPPKKGQWVSGGAKKT